MDGARAFNAAAAAKQPLAEMVAGADSVSLCFSKGLGCPVGSVLVGSDEFMYSARRFRKMVGGGMRQAGVLAACGLWALENTVPRLGEDHAKTVALARGLNALKGISINGGVEGVETNILYFVLDPEVMATLAFQEELAAKGVLLQSSYFAGGTGACRAVLHHQISDGDITMVIDAASEILANR
jgi:threonine aldolase